MIAAPASLTDRALADLRPASEAVARCRGFLEAERERYRDARCRLGAKLNRWRREVDADREWGEILRRLGLNRNTAGAYMRIASRFCDDQGALDPAKLPAAWASASDRDRHLLAVSYKQLRAQLELERRRAGPPGAGIPRAEWEPRTPDAYAPGAPRGVHRPTGDSDQGQEGPAGLAKDGAFFPGGRGRETTAAPVCLSAGPAAGRPAAAPVPPTSAGGGLRTPAPAAHAADDRDHRGAGGVQLRFCWDLAVGDRAGRDARRVAELVVLGRVAPDDPEVVEAAALLRRLAELRLSLLGRAEAQPASVAPSVL